jgi:hypothetical protein
MPSVMTNKRPMQRIYTLNLNIKACIHTFEGQAWRSSSVPPVEHRHLGRKIHDLLPSWQGVGSSCMEV